ncbi:MAG: hypothetical protein ABSE35_14730 [Bryobacteraceae bacterium]|jgi:hypothetical protein
MDLTKVLAQLRQELADLDAAIESLELCQQDRPRRGRPPTGQADASGEAHASMQATAEANGRNRDSA